MSFCMHIFFRSNATSSDSSRCIIDGMSENEYIVLTDMGDMMIEHSSGGNSTGAFVDSKNLCISSSRMRDKMILTLT